MTGATERPPAITRPNGRLYGPHKVVAYAVVNDDELTGVIVFGTHDPERALPLAAEYVRWQIGRGYTAADPLTGWWRDGFEGGRRAWVTDDQRGRAGVWFRQIVATPGGAT